MKKEKSENQVVPEKKIVRIWFYPLGKLNPKITSLLLEKGFFSYETEKYLNIVFDDSNTKIKNMTNMDNTFRKYFNDSNYASVWVFMHESTCISHIKDYFADSKAKRVICFSNGSVEDNNKYKILEKLTNKHIMKCQQMEVK